MNLRWCGPMTAAVLALASGLALAGGELAADSALYEGANHKFHARLKVDAAKKQATVWILDGKAKKQVPIQAKTIAVVLKGAAPITLKAQPEKGAVKASRFAGTHERFAAKLNYKEVELLINVDGKKDYTFTFDED